LASKGSNKDLAKASNKDVRLKKGTVVAEPEESQPGLGRHIPIEPSPMSVHVHLEGKSMNDLHRKLRKMVPRHSRRR
jgi:hypothetical protein